MKYRTKQRAALLDYLETTREKHITVADIRAHFEAQGRPIGTTTLYRQMDEMVREGVLRKYIVDENSAACFEYVGEDSHRDAEVCFHCKCEKCGKLIHLQCDELEEIQTHILKEHRFKMDPMRTVFYGLCENCMA